MTGEAYSSTHPPLPPTTEDQRLSWLRLLRSRGVGIKTFYRLLAEYGSAQNVLDALPEVAAAAGVKGYRTYSKDALDTELSKAKAASARLLCFGEPDYPKHLAMIPSPPPALWAIGDIRLLSRPSIALVGARNASSLGRRMAYALARELGEAGYTITSGLARGIDACAHEGALKTGTVAIQGGGVDIIYPAENAKLFEAIAEQGLRLSEQPMGLQPQARHFPPRNRIIAGLSLATIVVEAAVKSGSLITARDALDLGRDVMAVPGHPMEPRANGCNLLIRDGALLVRNARDVLEGLPPHSHGDEQAAPHIIPHATSPAPTIRDTTSIDTAHIAAHISAAQLAGERQEQAHQHREPQMLGHRPPSRAEAHPAPQARHTPPPETRSLQETSALHQLLLSRLSASPMPEGQLIQDLNTPARSVRCALTDLELAGEIDRAPGGLIARKR